MKIFAIILAKKRDIRLRYKQKPSFFVIWRNVFIANLELGSRSYETLVLAIVSIVLQKVGFTIRWS